MNINLIESTSRTGTNVIVKRDTICILADSRRVANEQIMQKEESTAMKSLGNVSNNPKDSNLRKLGQPSAKFGK